MASRSKRWDIESIAHLQVGDVRLTMGGEPTFVSIDNMDGAEWNTAALGKEKRLLAGQLLDRLRQRYAPGALLHFGQGKWYPGEQLPRWTLTCFWRKDGVPLWQDLSLLAREDAKYNFGPMDAQRFSETLASRLGVAAEYAIPALEDSAYYLQRERQLPINVDPIDNHLEDPIESKRVRAVFERGLDTPTGYVLPLQRGAGKYGPEWQSGLWMLRGQHLFLVPGDSPVGLRLPLPNLPWVKPSEAPQFHPVDPMAQRLPLPAPKHAPPGPPIVQRESDPPRDRKPDIGRIRSVDRPHSTLRGAERGTIARVHAARSIHGRLSRSAGGDRGHGGAFEDAGRDRRLYAAVRSSHRPDQSHARSRA